MPSKNKEIMAEIKGHELACVCSAKKSSILEQGTICFCGVGVLTAVITQLWSFGVFCGRFKINGMDGWMDGVWGAGAFPSPVHNFSRSCWPGHPLL